MWLARFKDTSKTGKLKGLMEETSRFPFRYRLGVQRDSRRSKRRWKDQGHSEIHRKGSWQRTESNDDDDDDLRNEHETMTTTHTIPHRNLSHGKS